MLADYAFQVTEKDVENILSWEKNQAVEDGVEVAFKPARVILQDFTGVPAVVDFAAMRDAVKALGGDPQKINPICPSDLVIDHSVQVDFSGTYVVAYIPGILVYIVVTEVTLCLKMNKSSLSGIRSGFCSSSGERVRSKIC